MEILEWIRFLAGTGLLLTGLAIFLLQIFGVFKFKYLRRLSHFVCKAFYLGLTLKFRHLGNRLIAPYLCAYFYNITNIFNNRFRRDSVLLVIAILYSSAALGLSNRPLH